MNIHDFIHSDICYSNCQREELREHVDKLKQTNKKFTSTNTTEKQKTEDAISDLNENHLRAIRLRYKSGCSKY